MDGQDTLKPEPVSGHEAQKSEWIRRNDMIIILSISSPFGHCDICILDMIS